MSRLRTPRLLAAPGLLLLAALLWLPAGLEARRAPVPKGLSADLALIPGDCIAFATFRPSDLLQDPQLAGGVEALGGPFTNQRDTRVPIEQVERLTFLTADGGDLSIVRTRKPYDAARLLNTLSPGFSRKKGKRAVEQKPGLQEKKVGGRTISWKGDAEPESWTDAVCQVDRHVFVAGHIAALEHLLTTKARALDELKDAVAVAGKHTLVICVQGAPLRTALAAQEKRRSRHNGDSIKEKKPEGADNTSDDPFVPPHSLPFKPLMKGRIGLLTIDVKPGLKADAKITFDDKADLEEGETALRVALYVGRELIGGTRQDPLLKPLAGLVKSAQTTLRSAKVTRDGTTLRTSTSLNPSAADRKLLARTLLHAARVKRCRNHLLQLALAMHSLASSDDHSRMPAAAITDKAGKPLLSWRVAILPYIDENDLYNQFKLDEPWDSPHNKKLLAKMPKLFAPLGIKTKEPYSTFFQVCTGPNTPWPTLATHPRLPASFPDGSSNTLLIVEASEAVPWTKPADLVIDPKKPLPKFGAHLDGVFMAVFVDGHFGSLRRNLAAKTLRLLIDPADGQIIPWDEIE
jgi:hypothetical protein